MTKSNSSKKILHIAQNRIISSDEMLDILADKNINRRIGALPWNLIQNYDKSKIGDLTKRVDIAFTEFASKISTELRYFECQCLNEIWDATKAPLQKLETDLRSILNTDNISANYWASGAFKHCFQLRINDTPYAIQLFIPRVYSSNQKRRESVHGALIEPQSVFAVAKLFSRGRVARPFMARVSDTEFFPSAYILMNFINDNTPVRPDRGHFLPRRDRIISDDLHRERSANTLRGLVVDVGGFYYNPNFIADKKLRNTWTGFAQILDEMDFYSSSSLTTQNELYKKYKEDPEKFFDTNAWPEMIRNLDNCAKNSVKRTLRSLQKLRTKRDATIQSGQWDEIQNLLRQDFINLFPFTRFNDDTVLPRDSFVWPFFYPKLVCEILGTSNIPPLQEFASWVAKHNQNKVDFHTNNGRIHWNKYFSFDEVETMCAQHPEYDWSIVYKDFNIKTQKKSFIQKFLMKFAKQK